MRQQLADLDGLSVTAFAQVVHTDVGNPFAFNPNTTGESSTHALGGIVGFAGGGMVRAEMAEYGPEMVRLAGGGMAMAWSHGTYDVPRQLRGDRAGDASLMGMGSPR
jgi:hypothetical protein